MKNRRCKMIVLIITSTVFAGCGDSGGDKAKSAQQSYCNIAFNKVEMCFGSLDNYGIDFRTAVNECSAVTCPGTSESTWKDAEEMIVGFSCNEMEEFLEYAMSGEPGSGCY